MLTQQSDSLTIAAENYVHFDIILLKHQTQLRTLVSGSLLQSLCFLDAFAIVCKKQSQIHPSKYFMITLPYPTLVYSNISGRVFYTDVDQLQL